MADDKRGRDKQAHDAAKRRQERDIATERERYDEAEPPVDADVLADIERDLASVAFPATGAAVVDAIGEREVPTDAGTYAVEALLPDTDEETFDSPAAVRVRIQRPTVAAAMKRIVEATEGLADAELTDTQRDGYERTFRELVNIDPIDENEGIPVVADWMVERIRENGELPGSRSVRRRAAEYCRANGYEVRNDEWLGV
ncbi:hypothetical protein [Halobaculum magnesiiphilum]|uniref:Uncharacterized protein n=1 Tax=Halobaculum magnesiiphilum TaxID=1017351 RepID=A0A8T8WA10_9EURY|nr:hypothetical protein [Halobaculum magnesiiphilum]QZP36689.1 hypothetical protein K6T50_10255 [Halobaculum magnesiiphilum]